jgi:hypothetical protein
MKRRKKAVIHPLITQDPATGGELLVTRLMGLKSGVVIEGLFSLGWIGRLTPDQLEFVGLLVRHRGNLQKLAAEMQIAYNTARNRMDEIVAALEGSPPPPTRADRLEILDRLASGAIGFEEASRLLDE